MDGLLHERSTARKDGNVKYSYTIPCSSAFRDAVGDLAARRHVNVGDIARSVLLALPATAIADFPDPGEPPAQDRETVILKSGPSQGRPWRRKPRLQVRMAPGATVDGIRRALALALALDRNELALRLEPGEPPPQAVIDVREQEGRRVAELTEEVARLRAMVSVLAFEPLPLGVTSRTQALYVLGFPADARPDQRCVRARFRMLATIHHPDAEYGDHTRMSQLNQAMLAQKE